MVPAFLTSLLSRQLALLGRPAFLRLHPHAWLVWEAGTWTAPSSVAESDTGATRLPTVGTPTRPEAGDALCFELVDTPAGETWLKVGRAPDSDIVLNDMTVSREQFTLVGSAQGWAWRDAAGGAAAPQALGDHASVQAGGLRLTFFRPAAFLERLAQAQATGGQ